ncbi:MULTISPECIES: hypothetical protein [unclassified Gemella]|nr:MULTISPECIES: hypothetical protein [unclassified Gemella]MBF0710549.1 hypothetical protein [Gemella sp. GL1.1]MBF0746282.1 hypothetical protein [Gemella sp. 19428wG2_WT2a]NYS27893.1 hypothetical protein [Gemella sp. GL1]
MFIYWLIIVITILKVVEFIERIKEKNSMFINIKKKRKNSIPSEIKYL